VKKTTLHFIDKNINKLDGVRRSEILNRAKYLEILELCNNAEVEEELLATEKNVFFS